MSRWAAPRPKVTFLATAAPDVPNAPNAPIAPIAPFAPAYYWPMMMFYVPPAVVAKPEPVIVSTLPPAIADAGSGLLS